MACAASFDVMKLRKLLADSHYCRRAWSRCGPKCSESMGSTRSTPPLAVNVHDHDQDQVNDRLLPPNQPGTHFWPAVLAANVRLHESRSRVQGRGHARIDGCLSFERTRRLVVTTKGSVHAVRRAVTTARRLVSTTRRLVAPSRSLVHGTKRFVAKTKRLVGTTRPSVTTSRRLFGMTRRLVTSTKGFAGEDRDMSRAG